MTTKMMKRILQTAAFVAATSLATPAHAQFNGENLLGDMGVKSGTQPEPGTYISTMYYRYFADSIKAADGTMSLEANQTINAGVPLVIYVSPKKIFGAHYGLMAVMPFANGSLEASAFGLSETASTGPSDLYVMPAQLGWHLRRADITTGFAFFAPTGRHEAGASDNLGKGMWSYEVSGGGTAYLDKQRSLSISTMAYWETHTKKNGEVQFQRTTVHDVKVGQLLTLEGGIGKSFLHGAASIGAAYYAQWKMTPDQMEFGSATPQLSIPDKHRVFGYGPDITIPIATKSKLIALVNARYLWETGAQIKTQGQSLVITTTFPVGGIKIPS